jgi:DNA-binding NtrC family response regulator
MSQNILIVEDDELLNQLITRYLTGAGYQVKGVRGWKEAERYLESHEPHLIITDVRLPDGDSLTRLPQIIERQPVIVLTGFGSVRNAVDSMKAGAFEYLVKPISPEELLLVVQRALQTAALQADHQFCKRRLQAQEDATSIMVGESRALGEVHQLIEAVAPTDMTVLIQGESGAGKELVARAIHQASPRAARNFVALDCCTLQATLFESELFGHERGAFTGADRQKKGLIEGAEGGTLFLDEIGEIEIPMQAKLLRVLETGKFRRVGGNRDLDANVRVVCATNRNLAEMSRKGTFRLDLYYRLSAFAITAPPLRERREDIPHLVEHFVRNHNFSRRISKGVTSEALQRLMAYDWPGNVRELKNVVERAIILSRDKPKIGVEHLAFGPPRSAVEAPANAAFEEDPTLDQLQGRYLAFQLRKHRGRRSKVAEVMGISERNLYRLIKRYGLADSG